MSGRIVVLNILCLLSSCSAYSATLGARGVAAASPRPAPPLLKLPLAKERSSRTAVKAKAPPEPEEAEEMSIKQMLSEYGLIALLFHFTVWVASLTTEPK